MSDEVVSAPVKSAWTSKINWTQAVAVASSLLVFVGGPSASLTPEEQAAVVVVITMIQGAVTWVMRTWYTTTIIASSAPVKP